MAIWSESGVPAAIETGPMTEMSRFLEDTESEPPKITPEQATSIRERAKACGADEGRLLTFANAKTYEEIRATKFAAVDEILRKKEREGAKPKTTEPAKKVGKGDANAKPTFDEHGNIVE